ncbi:MAG: hypothetical protein IPN71_06270 [Fibrobacteres bacterium]|nr:hypothetical protein [Fibrobacterota bacterium]
MARLDVRHYLGIYAKRKRMQEEGVTDPSVEMILFAREFVERLKSMPLDEEIILCDHTFYDSKGALILKIPVHPQVLDSSALGVEWFSGI